ncbi:MAG: type IV pilin protein [Motiliproteus sp.]
MKNNRGRNSQKGVTLLELMIVVAIIGILASVAYPSYQEFVKQGRRADAQGALMSFAGAMERHFTVSDSYCGAGTTTEADCGSGATHKGPPSIFSQTSPVGNGTDVYYALTIASVGPASFTIQADPAGAQIGDVCGSMTIDHTGARAAVGTDCWR